VTTQAVAEEDSDRTRHSQALEADLLQDPDELAAAEGRNGLRQIDKVIEIVEYYVQNKFDFKLRPSIILTLHRVALEGISSYAGIHRPAGIKIGGSQHAPSGAHLVPEQLEELCDYVNDHWQHASAIHLAAYVLWRLNWIHPFTDGNGRTARATSYLVLCLKLGYPIYAPESVPAQIAQNKHPYYVALEAADAAWRENRVDVSEIEKLLDTLLARQLLGIMRDARGESGVQ
jgi:Fic family protein